VAWPACTYFCSEASGDFEIAAQASKYSLNLNGESAIAIGAGHMPVSYKIDKKRRLIVTWGEGCVTFAEVRDHQDRLLNEPDFDETFNQLVDATRVTKLDVSAEEARVIASRQIVASTSRRAFVATEPSIYGVGRMMETYHGSKAQVCVFHSLDAALAWLGVEDLILRKTW